MKNNDNRLSDDFTRAPYGEKTRNSEIISLRLSKNQIRYLQDLAYEKRLSTSDIYRWIIDEYEFINRKNK